MSAAILRTRARRPLEPALWLVATVLLLSAGCARGPRDSDARPPLRYVGSSTIAAFLSDAEAAYGRARLQIETEPESAGGELAILEGRADLGGVAGCPGRGTLERGIVATPIGQDAIAVIVHAGNPVSSLTRDQLAGIFTGKVQSWRELGGPDRPIRPFLVGPASATRKVFRAAILGPADFAGYRTVTPDAAMLDAVAEEPGGIGVISFALLRPHDAVRAIEVDGQRPTPTNADYPLTRPLHLLWWPARSRVADFIAWITGPEAEPILLRRFAKPKAGVCDAPVEAPR